MEFLLILAILLAVVYVVTGPLRRPEGERRRTPSSTKDSVPEDGRGARVGPPGDRGAFEREAELNELEAMREAKYREIRDSQLDYDTGKLSQEDFEALDAGLRRQALEILDRIDRLEPPARGPTPPDGSEPGLREAE